MALYVDSICARVKNWQTRYRAHNTEHADLVRGRYEVSSYEFELRIATLLVLKELLH